ncbi:DEAD/DEAH box helicase family protein [Methanosarcina vacuolata]|uniref:Type I restriction-modification system, restriction subunit R n=1 Tax=Methanosarcina vacuolata Z-761 TaxID=1434123 RepID=A0A0E3LHE3_9EURY|nr:DEAD/DEAH box helicase family protein [Methanosarcina vacuolata]AKB44121.1 Type I restriction-modification system, restriction subunit R [Methanosarcina vacuolata Z-761]
MTNFAFLEAEWPSLYEAAEKASNAVYPDPRTACFYARRALELAVQWIYKYDYSLLLPYQENLSALIHEPTFKKVAGEAIFNKARVIIQLGNEAVHSNSSIQAYDSVTAVSELFHITYWLARTYARKEKPEPGLSFNPDDLPKTTVPKQTIEQLQNLENSLREKDEKLSLLLADKSAMDEELKRLRAEVAKAKEASALQPDTHDYSEAETRKSLIDLLLKEAGWALDKAQDREFEVSGMPNESGVGFVDYVLWGDDGKPLALVEAKRTTRDPQVGQQQAKLYADCLEKQFGQRPVIFYSNGYENWIWDDSSYPPRQVQGFYKKSELELLIQRRSSRRSLSGARINSKIADRYYQSRAIRRIGESIEQDNDRKALVVMATGAGKTRTVIALCDLLMRCNWVKRVLFLADRVALVNQAVNSFKRHLPDSAPVNLVTEKDTDGRVFVSTYPTMMKQIEEMNNGQRRFGSGHFDLVIIDEAHRSVFKKYRAIFDYFDSFLVGLTATPKNEIERNTYSLFDLEPGVPTDAYQLEEAVKDGFLVPPKAVSVPLKFQRQGINYDDLSDEDKEQWESLDWGDEEGEIPGRVEADAVNKWLFNKDTVDKVLAHLMERGLKVAGGDRLGKTILFAKNQAHAEYIAERFNASYPHFKGEFARVITFKTEYAQSLIDNFSIKEKAPHIAISVDMLDTGIDVPEVVNLVFFKLVRSRTKFWQMLGRGTRLCPDLFEPGTDKQFFYLFDYCQNLEFFSQNPETTDGSLGDSLGTRLFKSRLELLSVLDRKLESDSDCEAGAETSEIYGEPKTEAEVRFSVAGMLHSEIASMNLDNFVVRPRRRLVEKYSKPEAWIKLSSEDLSELSHEIAVLPSELQPEAEEAKRFDLLVLNLQLALLRAEPAFERLTNQVRNIAGLLEEKSAIPMVRDQMALILDVQTDEWWENVTTPMLESLRRRLRNLVKLVEKHHKKPIYTDFKDEIGSETDVELPGFAEAGDFEKFRAKTRAFLLEHQDNNVIHKLRMNIPLAAPDLDELERILSESGLGGPEEIVRAREVSNGLGLFVRSLIGLDREAAKQSLATFLTGKTLTANQIEFINLIINHLTEHGAMDAALLYESPFTDLTPQGPDGLFTSTQIDELIATLEQITATALVPPCSQQITA